jgi:hypothetical protein
MHLLPLLLHHLQGEELSMDYAPEKLDGGVLLDYGCLDKTSPRVSAAG